MLNDEWLQFLEGGEGSGIGGGGGNGNEEREKHEQRCSEINRTSVEHEDDIPDVPIPSPLYVSTTTKIVYTCQFIDIVSLFWDLEILPYSERREGILKKQMKCSSNSLEEVNLIQEKLASIKTHPIQQEIISFHDTIGRLKFQDVRKISVGICSKDLVNKFKKKSAFYNCIVVIIRARIRDIFREYHVKIFNTGKMEIPGIQTDDELDIVVSSIVQQLQELLPGIHIRKEETDTVLINSNFNCGFFINRDVLYDILQWKYKIQCVYDPCSYPGIQCKFFYNSENNVQTGLQNNEDIKGKGYGYNKSGEKKIKNKMLDKKTSKYTEVSIMIFRTGSVLLVGMCTMQILYEVYEFLKKTLAVEYLKICQQGIKTKGPSKNSRKKKIKKFIESPSMLMLLPPQPLPLTLSLPPSLEETQTF